MIGIQIAGKNNRISANVLARSLTSFLDLLKDVDSAVSKQSKGSVRWEVEALEKNSPALIKLVGVSKTKEMDYSDAIQESLIDGLEQLAERPEQPNFYSYSALRKAHRMAALSKDVRFLSIFTSSRRMLITDRVTQNVDYLMATGSKSLGSVRGSLDAVIVHAGHEFRVWSPKWKRPITCYFDRSMLSDVAGHLKQEVEVIGEVHRNQKGEPVIVKVSQFLPLEPVRTSPRIEDLRGMLSNIYGGKDLKGYMEELRNG
jgi:hypothetical protein